MEYTPRQSIPANKINTPGFVSAFSSQEEAMKALDSSYVPRTPAPVTPPASTGGPDLSKYKDIVQTQEDPNAPKMRDAEAIREAARLRAQAIVNSINAQFAPLFQEQGELNKRNEARTRALNIGAGLAGSDFASSAAVETEQRGQKANRLLEDEKQARIAVALGNADREAEADIRAEREAFRQDTEFYQKQKSDRITKAKESIGLLAGDGVSVEKLKQAEPNIYQYLFKNSGYGTELEFDAYFNKQKPTEEQVKYTYHTLGGGRVLRTGVDAQGRAVAEKVLDYSVPEGGEIKEYDGVPYVVKPDGKGGFSAEKLAGVTESEKSKLEIANKRLQNAKLVKELAEKSGKEYLTEPLNAIDQLKGDDGYINPQAYRDLYAEFVRNNPGKGDEFLKNFPTLIYINPNEQYQFSK